MKRHLYLQLGRAGDILNVLPLCHRDWQRGGASFDSRPMLMVHADFARLLEGVSYVEPILYTAGPFEDVARASLAAQEIAVAKGAELMVTQIYGRELYCARSCSSFLRESWERVPDAPAWGTLPLVFDRRNPAREQAVIEQLLR